MPYNGNGGATYGTAPTLSGAILAELRRLRRRPPCRSKACRTARRSGIALIDANGAVVQFQSYEGAFAATNGPAIGLTSVDIGVTELEARDARDVIAAPVRQRHAVWPGLSPGKARPRASDGRMQRRPDLRRTARPCAERRS